MSAIAVEFPEIEGRAFKVEAVAELASDDALPAIVDAPAGDLVEWTPERAAALVRGMGYALHTIDPATELDGGAELWRATSEEADEIGGPLARILARYEPARRLAGVVDEAELGAALVGYTKRNLRMRGRAILAERDRVGQAFASDDAE